MRVINPSVLRVDVECDSKILSLSLIQTMIALNPNDLVESNVESHAGVKKKSGSIENQVENNREIEVEIPEVSRFTAVASCSTADFLERFSLFRCVSE